MALSPLTVTEYNELLPSSHPLTAPARSASFAALQDSKSVSSGRMTRSSSTNKLSSSVVNSSKSKDGSGKGKYDVDADLRMDIETCREALELFLASRMRESESLLKEGDPKMERLYIASGYGLIQSVKAFMSFEEKDLANAIDLSRSGSALAHKHRKPLSLTSRVTGLVTGSTSSVNFFKSMTPTQRHAELVYAECLAQKAILGIVYSGDWLQFIKEAINMRACIGLYRSMYAYLEALDAEADAAQAEQAQRDGSGSGGSGGATPQLPSGPATPGIEMKSPKTPMTPKTPKTLGTLSTSSIPAAEHPDEDFRSGVCLGMGVIHLILSLLPSRVLPILELFGYKGDRSTALRLLERAGGWGVLRERLTTEGGGAPVEMQAGGVVEPGIGRDEEGLRRSLCDMVLLMFHLVFSTITYNGIDVPFASQILGYNAARYPRGIFFLFGQGRLALFKGDPMAAIKFYMTGMEVVGGKGALRGLEGVGMPDHHQVRLQNGDDTYEGSDDEEEGESDFKSLQGLALWELAVARLALWDIRGSVGSWRRLREEAGWSKAVYAYGLAVGLYELGEEEPSPSLLNGNVAGADMADVRLEVVDDQLGMNKTVIVKGGGGPGVRKSESEEAVVVMESVPGLIRRIAGKSIPFEKFVARRSKKFKAQGHRLLLPALELAYILLGLPRAPRTSIFEKMLPSVDAALAVLKAFEGCEDGYCGVGRAGRAKAAEIAKCKTEVEKAPCDSESEKVNSVGGAEKEKVGENGYWDDYCLAQFLRGLCLRYIAYPDSFVTVTGENPMADAAAQAKAAFESVLENGMKIVYDHHIVYWTHYELGKLEARNGDKEEAKRHIELVLSGKVLEVNWHGRKGKYSLENALNVRAHAAMEGLEQDQLL